MQSADQFFSTYAIDFNSIYGADKGVIDGLINRLFRRSMLLRFKNVVNGCQPVKGKTILDIGCGPGHYGIALARMGAKQILGIDPAEGMITMAQENAKKAGLKDQCNFALGDFMKFQFGQKYDFSIIMGVMDYIPDPRTFIEKVYTVTAEKAFFSFPSSAGLLALQRRIKYRERCPLYLYHPTQIRNLFNSINASYTIDKISRDYFVIMQTN